MGGYGSGRWGWHDKANTVEESKVITLSGSMKQALKEDRPQAQGILTWHNRWDEERGSIGWILERRSDSLFVLTLNYGFNRQAGRQEIKEPICLIRRPMPKGGYRWWFLCPLSRKGDVRACGKRVAKLYLPPGGLYFGCRTCWRLTYTSCQESHQFDSLHQHVAMQLGITPAMVKQVLKNGLF